MYNRKQGHTTPHSSSSSSSSNSSDASTHSTWSHAPAAPVGYELDKKASAQLKVSGFVLPKQTPTFFYRTPMEIFPTMSTKGDTIAVVALMGDIGEEQTVQLITSTGVQVSTVCLS
jgi:LysM repeat protein